MKNKIIIIKMAILGCILINFSAKAQNNNEEKNKRFIGLTGGFSSVFGNYAKANYSDLTSGFASSGTNYGLTGVYFIKGHFGIKGLISMNNYGFHGSQSLADGYQNAFDVDDATFIQKGTNKTFNVLVGPFYSFSLTEQLHFDVEALAGFTQAWLAGNKVLLEDESQIVQKKSTAGAFGYQIGVGLHYDLGSRYGIGINIDYVGANPDFQIENENRNNKAGRLLTEYHQPIQGANLNLMVIYRL